VLNALTMLSDSPLSPPDHYEPNDDAGPWAHALPPLPRTIGASLDYWDDNIDVYRIRLKAGQRLFARLSPRRAASVRLALWAPGARHVDGLHADTSLRLESGHLAGAQTRLAYRAPEGGVYYLEAKLVSKTHDPVGYALALSRRSP
jgi:hypothetical protein